jgi:GH24 family phage-related lysozyme (muramidase)
VNRLTEHRIIGEFVPGLRGIFSDFDGYPLPARRALLDLAYNLGVHGVSKFTHLIAACESGNWHTAAEECSTKNGRVDRNEWRSAMFLEAASPAVA